MDYDGSLIDGLLDATSSRNISLVESLIQSGVDPCTSTRDGTTPFHKAAVIESPFGSAIVSIMLNYGADPNIRTNSGLSPLHIAAMWGRVATINLLLDYGADVTMKDYDDMSALDYAEDADECRDESIDALTRFRMIRDENDSGCETTGIDHNKQNYIGKNYYLEDKNCLNTACYCPSGEFYGNYYWCNHHAINAVNSNYYNTNGYQPYGYHFNNKDNNNNATCGNGFEANYYSNKETQLNDRIVNESTTNVKNSTFKQDKTIDSHGPFTDISDVSDSENESDDSCTESFWSISSVPHSRNSSITKRKAEESDTDSFWSVSSVPYDKRVDRSTMDSIVRKLDKELVIADTVDVSSVDADRSLAIDLDDVAVIMCGIQESYRWKISHFHKLCDVAERLIAAINHLDIPILISEDPTYEYGPTVREIDTSDAWIFENASFSGISDEMKNSLLNMKSSKKISNIILFGIEAHVSVQLTALDLLDAGYQVYVVRDATYSRLHDDKMFALERIRQSGGSICSFETILCHLMKDNSHPKYDKLKEFIPEITLA